MARSGDARQGGPRLGESISPLRGAPLALSSIPLSTAVASSRFMKITSPVPS
jgi:hypothetical protein